VVQRGATLFQALADSVARSDIPPEDKVAALVRGHVGIITSNQEQSATFLNEARFLPADGRIAIVTLRDRYEATFREVIAEGIAIGAFRAQNPALAGILVLSVLNALTRWYRPTGAQNADEIADAMVAFVMDGLQ